MNKEIQTLKSKQQYIDSFFSHEFIKNYFHIK